MREFTVMFHSVNEIAQFATIANRQPFPVQTPVSVELPDRAADGSFLSDIAQFLCDPDA